VRPAGHRDLNQLADILTSSFYSEAGWQSWIYPLLRIGIQEDLKQRFRNAPPNYICLAGVSTAMASDQQDWIVGTVELAPKGKRPWEKKPWHQLYLSNLAVRATHRRTGVARQLLKACEQNALAGGFTELFLHVMEDNQPARQLYEQAGYRLEQIEANFMTFLGQPRRLRLRKVLSNKPFRAQ
jgi:ribosomal protein S18 acetylase RimI-like enzyme